MYTQKSGISPCMEGSNGIRIEYNGIELANLVVGLVHSLNCWIYGRYT